MIYRAQVLRDADFSALTYSGLMPLDDAIAPAVELCARRSLRAITFNKCPLPVRTLLGLPPLRPAPQVIAKELSLKWMQLGALDAKIIATFLRQNRSLTRIDISWNTDLSSGAIALASALADNRVLTDVDLSETSLGSAATDLICRAIVDNRALTRLNMRSCGMSAEARDALQRAATARTLPLDLTL